jgi:hypothetical protein
MKKEKENNKVALVIELPMPSFQPVNGRIFVKDIAGEDLKTKSGLYIPTNFTTMKGDYKQKWQHKRYFVLAVADDVNIQIAYEGEKIFEGVPYPSKSFRPLQRGDEVAIAYHEDAQGYNPVQVMDFTNGELYITFHETEIMGAAPGVLEPKE